MKVLNSKKPIEITREDLVIKTRQYKRVILDLGTGDGKNLIKQALTHHDYFYIGVDSSIQNLNVALRELHRKKIENVWLLNYAVELLPEELTDLVEEVFILFPWGSLLEGVVLCTEPFMKSIKMILKANSKITTIFGYSQKSDPSLKLPKLDLNYIKNNIVHLYLQNGFKPVLISELNSSTKITSWGARLAYGKSRDFYHLEFVREVVRLP